MNQESKPLRSARAHLIGFLNKEVAIPETLLEYRKTLLSLFEDLKVEISQEVAQITDILEIEAYFVELDEQICSSETSLKEEIDAAQQEEDAYPYSRTLTQILRQEGVVEFDIHDLSRHPDRSMELRRIEHYHGEFQEEAYTYLISFFDDFILQRINERRNDTLDACLYRRFEFAFYDRLCNSLSIKNEDEFEAFEIFLALEKYAYLNFAWEIDINFSCFRSEVTKEYLNFLLERLEEFRRISANAQIGLPGKHTPLSDKVLARLAQRRQEHEKWFEDLEMEIKVKLEHQKIRFFPRNQRECAPGSPKEQLFLEWLKDNLRPFTLDDIRKRFRNTQEFVAAMSLVNNPREWGPEEHETVLRLKEYLAMERVPVREFVFLYEFWTDEGKEEGFMVRY